MRKVAEPADRMVLVLARSYPETFLTSSYPYPNGEGMIRVSAEDCPLPEYASWPGENSRTYKVLRGHPVDSLDGLALERIARAVRKEEHRPEDGTLENLWRAFLAQLQDKNHLRWNECFLDGTFGKTKRGKGSKLRVRVEDQGTPIGVPRGPMKPGWPWWNYTSNSRTSVIASAALTPSTAALTIPPA